MVWQDVRLRVYEGDTVSLATHGSLEPEILFVLTAELVQVVPQGRLALPVLQP